MPRNRTIALALMAGLSLYACRTTGVSKREGSAGGGSMAPAPELPKGYAEKAGGDGWTTVVSSHGRRPGDKKHAMSFDFRRAARREAKSEAGPVSAAPTADRAVAGKGGGVGAGARPAPRVQISALKAGEVDDNAAFRDYVLYHQKQAHFVPASYRMDIAERYRIEARDAAGTPLPNCRVTVAALGQTWMTGLTDARGGLWFFPRTATVTEDKPAMGFQVTFAYGGQRVTRTFARTRLGAGLTQAGQRTGQPVVATPSSASPAKTAALVAPKSRPVPGAWTASLKVKKAVRPVTLEVLFLLDTTGSMADEIAQVQRTLLAITEKIRRMPGQPRIRYGMVLYRDRGDEYVTRRFGFTEDVQAFDRALRGVRAGGGGDMPESMNLGLYAAVDQMEWSPKALRLAFLVADAPPHQDYVQDVPYPGTLRRAVEKGIKIFPTAASGLDARGSYVMRQIAQYTGAKFLFIEYGQSGASHGVSGAYDTNNLDDLVLRIVRSELEHYAR